MKIEIIDIRIVENPKSTLAFVDVRIDGIVIKDFRIMTNGKIPYVRTPFSTYKDKSGKLQFRPIIIFSGEVEWKIHITILENYRQRQEDKNARKQMVQGTKIFVKPRNTHF